MSSADICWAKRHVIWACCLTELIEDQLGGAKKGASGRCQPDEKLPPVKQSGSKLILKLQQVLR